MYQKLLIQTPIEITYKIEDGRLVVGSATWPSFQALKMDAEAAYLKQLARDTFDDQHDCVRGRVLPNAIVVVRRGIDMPFQCQLKLTSRNFILQKIPHFDEDL